jgi:hypothetical protein
VGQIKYYVLRPSDLVWFTITADGLHERAGGGGAELVADGPQARLIVEFPSQHIAETLPAAGSSSSQARPAGPSRLHFLVDDKPIPLSVNGILSAMNRLLLQAGPRTQGEASTLELPWRVLLGLEHLAGCAHRSAPATSADGVTELWHTRIVRADKTNAAVYPIAILPVEPPSPFADQTPLDPYFNAISHQLTANPEQQMSVDRLILSACGAWFSGSIRWPQLGWTHRVAMARDFYVRVSERGVLFPFGHQAAFVDIVERQFSSGGAFVAALHATRSLMITEPAREYGIAEPAFPFQGVELGPLLVTDLDQPASPSIFWPAQNGSPVLFSVRARTAGDVIEMRLPLLFHAGAQSTDQLDAIYAQGPHGFVGAASHGFVSADFDAPARPSAAVGRFMPIAMKNPTEPLEGAMQQVQSLTFGGKAIPGDVGFHPVVTGLEVGLPAVRQLLQQGGSLSATLSDELLNSLPGAPPDVLLQFPSYPLNFGAARAAVVAAPNVAVDRLHRLLGPVTAGLPTDPAQLFPDTATLLGIVPLRSLIAEVTGSPTITWSAGAHPVATLKWEQTLAKPCAPFAPTSGATCKVSLTVTTKPLDGRPAGPPSVVTDGTITNFTLSIPPAPAPQLLQLAFTDLSFHAESGALPRVAFTISDAKLTGTLAFVQSLQSCLPSVGKTAPAVDVSDKQIRATFVTVVPTPLALGIFTLRNLLLKAAITVSLVNEPVLVEFGFASREQPFLVAVSGFGGGGYLELAIGAGGSDGGLQRFVGALEFGACAAMDFGVAAGEVHVFGGVVFTKQGQSVEITGYLRIGGMVRVLGLISVSVELTIALTYTPNVLSGSAKLVITVDLTFWSKSVEIGCSRTFAGSAADGPALHAFDARGIDGGLSVHDALGPDAQSYPWRTYCQAFAEE